MAQRTDPPLQVHGNASSFRSALKNSVKRAEDLRGRIRSVESRYDGPIDPEPGFLGALHDIHLYEMMQDFAAWQVTLRRNLHRYLGAEADKHLPPLMTQRDNALGIPAQLRLWESQIDAVVEHLHALLWRIPSRQLSIVGRPEPDFSDLRVSGLVEAEIIEAAVRRMATTMRTRTQRSAAIGAAKSLVEATYKAALRRLEVPFANDDFPALGSKVRKQLAAAEAEALGTEGKRVVERMMSGLNTIDNALAPLRNRYGDGHGDSHLPEGLGVRHARLAVDVAVTEVRFVVLALVDLGLVAATPD